MKNVIKRFFCEEKKENTNTTSYSIPNVSMEDDEVLVAKVANIIFETGITSASEIKEKLNLTYTRTLRLIDILESRGVIGEFRGSAPREILINKHDYIPQKNFKKTNVQRETNIDMDIMDGPQFEHYCASLLKSNGFQDVTVTQISNDQGVDILASKDGIKYAIQCKCYSSDLGNTPIQEVTAGKMIYGCHVGAVMTNRYFTSGAKKAAEATGTLLWDRNVVLEMAKNSGFI